MNYKLYASATCAALLIVALIFVALVVGDSSLAVALNMAVLILGLSLGWMVGIIASPYDAAEQQQFSTMAKAVTVFFSGYAAGKVDALVTTLFSPAFALESAHGFRIVGSLSAFTISLAITFIFRRYALLPNAPAARQIRKTKR